MTWKLSTGPPARQVLLAPGDEVDDDVLRELQREEEPDPVIAPDGTRRGHVDVCRVSNNRRTRCRDAAVARPRIISRSPGSSVRTVFSPSGTDGMCEDEPDGLLGRAPTRAGDTGDRDRDVGTEPLPGAVRHRRGRLRGDRSVLGEDRRGHAEGGLLDPICVCDDRAQEDLARAGNGREARGDHASRAGLRGRERQPTLAAEAEDDLGDRALVLHEEVPAERRAERVRDTRASLLRARIDEQVDVDLELAGADRHLHAVALPARRRERLGDGRLGRSEEAEHPVLACRSPRQHTANSLGLERPGPEPLELPRWPREDDDDHGAEIEHEARCRSGEPERLRALRPRRLLAHARREVHVRPPETIRDHSRDRADLFFELAVENQLLPGDMRDELDRPVVVRRPQAARDEAEICVESLPERVLEVLGRDLRRSRSAPAPAPGAPPRRRGTVRCGPSARPGRARSR